MSDLSNSNKLVMYSEISAIFVGRSVLYKILKKFVTYSENSAIFVAMSDLSNS